MAIADLVSGKVTEPLSVRALVGERAAEPSDVLDLAERHGARMVDFKFTDLPGTWQHMGMALASLDEEALTDGIGFDGSSIRGFQEIEESDMLLLPDPSTAIVDPFYEAPTISLVCTVLDPITREPYTRDPRYVAIKAEEHLRSSGVADVPTSGPRRSSTSSTTSPSISRRTPRSTRSTPRRVTGRRGRGSSGAARGWPRSATRTARRRAISRPRRTTPSAICAPPW